MYVPCYIDYTRNRYNNEEAEELEDDYLLPQVESYISEDGLLASRTQTITMNSGNVGCIINNTSYFKKVIACQ